MQSALKKTEVLYRVLPRRDGNGSDVSKYLSADYDEKNLQKDLERMKENAYLCNPETTNTKQALQVKK